MSLDAIIIADTGQASFSGSSPLRLDIEGRVALVQVAANYVENGGRIVTPIRGDKTMSWASAPRYNGIFLLNYLKKRGFDVALIDGFHEEREAFSKLLEEQPRSVIVSTTHLLNKKELGGLTEEIRGLAPDLPIIAGGPLIYSSFLLLGRADQPDYDTESPKEAFLFLDVGCEPDVDLYIVSQRGEDILCDALNRIRQGRSLEDLPNTAKFDGQSYLFSRRADELSRPFELEVDWMALPGTIFKSGSVTMQASNGCPYRCAFCNFVKDRRQMFVKPIDQLLREMQDVASRGVRYVRFVDDNFRLGSDDLNTFARRLVDEEIPIHWITMIRANTLANADLELLRRAGCMEVQMGLESADPQILRNMNKKADPELYTEVIRNVLAAGINCQTCFVFGFPGETGETVRRTVDFIKGIESLEYEGVFSWAIYPFILAPLSPIYEPEARKQVDLTGYMQNWKHHTMDSERAKEHVIEAFLELDDSSPWYGGDNIDMLLDLGPRGRKEFVKCRHRFAKKGMKGQLDRQDMLTSFKKVFAGHS